MKRPVKLAEKPRPNLGDRGTFDHTLYRRRYREMREWAESGIHTPQTGIYIGYRLLQNGAMDGEWGDESGNYDDFFVPSSYIEAWLFVIDPRQKPVYVLPEHATMDTVCELETPLQSIRQMADLGNTTGITLEHAQSKLREIQRMAAEALKGE